MKFRFVLLFAGGMVIAALIFFGVTLSGQASNVPAAPAAPDVFASPVNGGCYIAAPGDCRLHIEPVVINLSSGSKLVAFQVQANGVTIYDYKTDVSNPPPPSGTTYTPSLVAQDFAAVCGRTYAINVLGKANTDGSFLNMGLTGSFTCPSAVP
jgi:hypothetical protein